MNLWCGGFLGTDGGWYGPGTTIGGNVWRVYLKMSDFIDPGPARTFLFLDVREDGIDWGNFMTDMTGYPDQFASTGFYDHPGFYHGGACGFSFVDGHAEIKKWLDGRTTPPVLRDNVYGGDSGPSPRNKDVVWLQERATRKLK